MPRKRWFLVALTWTAFVTVLCLVNSNSLPTVSVSSFDKYAHAFFHFIFTVLWYMYFRNEDRKASNFTIVVCVLAMSLFFGILLEIAQKLLTVNRQADLLDVLANFTGALIAGALLYTYRRWFAKGSA